MASTTIKYFAFAHLPAYLQVVSAPIGELAQKLESALPDGPEKSAGMRKLLEAKDCFVRSELDIPKSHAPTIPPHQQRVIAERNDLSEKVGKLGGFFDTEIFGNLGDAEQVRLRLQHSAMKSYLEILGYRIDAF